MTKGLITAALLVSSVYGPIQAQNSTNAIATSAIAIPISLENSLENASGTIASTPTATSTQFVDNTGVMAYVKKAYANEPLLIDIARCESSFRQYDNATGDVLHGKTDPEDIGVMQINEKYQLDKAASLGYDIDTVEGNVAYAQYLYNTQGAAPWSASQSCWSSAYEASEASRALALK